MSKKLSKNIASSGYFDIYLIALSATSVSISVASIASVIGVPGGIANASFSLTFSMSTGIVKKLLKTMRNKKKNLNKIVMLARSKLNSKESKISEALMNNRIGNEDFMTIINEEKTIENKKKALE